MATPLSNIQAPLLHDKSVLDGLMLRSGLSGLRTFHRAAAVATASPTDPYGVLDGTDAQAASVIITAVPNGANFLMLFHDYRDSAGTLTTAPVVRVFGEVPEQNPANQTYEPSILTNGPSPVVPSTSIQPPLPSRHWVPLGELSTGNIPITVGGTTPVMVVTIAGNDWYRSSPAFVALLGVSRVLVTISTAAVSAGTFTANTPSINGCFGY